MFENLENDIKKIVLAGIGALAATVEKSKELIDDLVKKGELTVEQGKALNQELRHDLKTKQQETESAICVEKMSEQLERLNAADLEKIKEKLAQLEQENSSNDQ